MNKELGHIPTSEEVLSVFKRLINGENFKVVRKLKDKNGLYLWDIIIFRKDGNIEYSYMRKGCYPEGQASGTAIHTTFFDTKGVPVGGNSVAKYVEGKWKIFS